jgi:hypothetical protein
MQKPRAKDHLVSGPGKPALAEVGGRLCDGT